MTSDDDESPMSKGSIRLTPSQFEVIFQVTKEFPNLPGAVLEQAGWDNADVDRMMSMVRGVRGRIEGVAFVQIYLGGVEQNEDPPAPPRIVRVGQGRTSIKQVSAVLPYRLGQEWLHLAESVVSSLGAHELFLRTGYYIDEVVEAISWLSGDG